MPRLDFYEPTNHRHPFVKVSLHDQDVLIGRGPDCTVQLEDERVSRVHAVISQRGPDDYWIEDRSKHGTRVNADRIVGPRPLGAGDRIYIEGFVIVFQHDHVPPKDLEQESTRPD